MAVFLKAAFLKVGGFWKHINDFFVRHCFIMHGPVLDYVLVIWKIWIHWAMQVFQMLTHFIIQCQTITFIRITTDFIIKSFKYWYTLKLKLFFHCKAGILLLAISTFSCFPWSDNLTLFLSETTVCQTPTSEQASFVFKWNGYSTVKQLAQLTARAIFLETTMAVGMHRGLSENSPFPHTE